jgi:hypothetical protein
MGSQISGVVVHRRKIILVNGPPGSGKDTIGGMFHQQSDSRVEKFSKYLKESTHRLYNIKGRDGTIVPHDYFEHRKDQPCQELGGAIPRQCYIGVDKYLKSIHGDDILGRKLLDRLVGYEHWRSCVVTDSGFFDEAMVLVRHYGVDNIAVIRLQRVDCCFTNDSRGYVTIPGACNFDVVNNGRLSDLATEALSIAKKLGVANEGAGHPLKQVSEEASS